MDWLYQDLPSIEGREAARADDGGTSYKVSRRGSSIVQGRDIGSSRKGKTPRIIVSNTSSDDGDNRDNRGVATLVVTVKIVKTPVRTMEQAVLLIVVMLIKLIMACRGRGKMKIIMAHKILIMDIG